MAAIARREWSDLKTEFILRVGRENDTAFAAAAGRAEQFLAAAYLWISKAFHHHELEVTETSLVLNTANNQMDISSIFPCIVQGVELQAASDGAFIKMLRPTHLSYLATKYVSSSGEPLYFTQHGTDILVDRLPDAAYKTKIYYLDVEPTAPDYSTGSPGTGRAWDEFILELAIVLAHTAVGRFDSAGSHSQIYQLFTGEMPQPRTTEDGQRGVFEDGRLNKTLGGAHG